MFSIHFYLNIFGEGAATRHNLKLGNYPINFETMYTNVCTFQTVNAKKKLNKSWKFFFNDGDLKSVGEQNYKTCLANRCWTIHTNWTKKSL